MLRRDLLAKKRRNSFPTSLKALRRSYAATLLGNTSENVDTEHIRAIEALQLLLDSQRNEIADKDAALDSFKLSTRDITISTVPVEKLMGLPTFKNVESWSLQFTTNKNLKVMENISPESRSAIDLEANSRGLSVDESWITFTDPDILVMIKACFPQKSEGEELSSNQFVEKLKASVHLLFPGEKGSLTFIHRAINFCNLLPAEKANDTILQKGWIFFYLE